MVKIGEALSRLRDPHNGQGDNSQVTPNFVHNDDSILQFFRQRGRAAYLERKSVAHSPFGKAQLSGFGRRCAAAWLKGWRQAKGKVKRAR